MLSVPEAKVFAGLADVAVKSAPELTTAPVARTSVTRAPSASLRLGDEHPETGHGGTHLGIVCLGWASLWGPRAGNRAISHWVRPLALRPRLATGLP